MFFVVAELLVAVMPFNSGHIGRRRPVVAVRS
jgi:hypothetical protein